MRNLALVLTAAALVGGTSSAQTPSPPAATNYAQSSEPRAYLDRAIALFRQFHINSKKMDWPVLWAKAHAAAADARTPADTYPAIRLIIKELGEKHTFLMTPDQARAQETGKSANGTRPPALLLPDGERLAEDIGVIRLYGFGGSQDQAKLYSAFGRAKITEFQARGICRFVVDLRPNTGGNMYPMIDAVSGLLDEGVLGTFENAAGQFTPWILKDGTATVGTTVQSLATQTAPATNSYPVAVLLGPLTASAGEYTAMSFKGRTNTRFFGTASAGFVTANQPMPLSDGAVIIMTSAWGFDRTGKKYVDVVEPDEDTGAGGPALDAAVKWLSAQRCTARMR